MRFTDIKKYTVLASTNDKARELALSGAAEGTSVLAERQTAGRGRLQRDWYSEAGNLYISCILRPRIAAKWAPQLTFVTALAVKETCDQFLNQSSQLKWPNDVMVDGKKISGILTELEARDDTVDFIVIGVGMNINQTEFPDDIAALATSLAKVSGKTQSIDKVAQAFLRHLEKWYALYLKEGFDPIREHWVAESGLRGRKVVVQDGDSRIEGIAEGLHDDGALRIKPKEGPIQNVYAGDLICY